MPLPPRWAAWAAWSPLGKEYQPFITRSRCHQFPRQIRVGYKNNCKVNRALFLPTHAWASALSGALSLKMFFHFNKFVKCQTACLHPYAARPLALSPCRCSTSQPEWLPSLPTDCPHLQLLVACGQELRKITQRDQRNILTYPSYSNV